jgi:uridine kinase
VVEREDVARWADETVRRALDLRSGLGRGLSVGISGVDCAGKSTLAEAVCDRLAADGVAAVLLEGDEFTRPTRERYERPDQGAAYYHDSFDYRELFDSVLPAVRNSFRGDLRIRVTDWDGDTWKERNVSLARDAVLVVEGCFLFADGAANEFDLSVWLELPLERILERALQRPRDLERMGGPDGVRSRYTTRYIPGQRLHLERDRPQAGADLVLEPRRSRYRNG